MPKFQTPKLYDKEVLDGYNYPQTRIMVLNFFSKYRAYSMQVGEICYEYNPTMSNDSMGIFSSKINDAGETILYSIAGPYTRSGFIVDAGCRLSVSGSILSVPPKATMLLVLLSMTR